MIDKLVLTYSLLGHLKETSQNPAASLIDIFVPIAKKALSEYSKERGLTEIKGKSFCEIQVKIQEIFGLEIPLPVLDEILNQIQKEINDESVFCIYGDGSFIIKSYIFSDLESQIEEEKNNIHILEKDYEAFCVRTNIVYNFEDLETFIFAQKVDLFSDMNSSYLDLNYAIPKYISLKFEDEPTFKIITNIYLGGIISSYLTLKISKKVTNTELLLDTNFFISLINLNTEEANNICNQLFKICKEMGFRFTMLYSTVEQIRILLNTRIGDFASKDLIGTVRCADIFNACIRRELDKTQLERIKDSIPQLINDFGIVVIQEAQIKVIVDKAIKSKAYKELRDRRGNDLSALNDAVAEIYVMQKRGKCVQEFSDVDCWFLHNSFNTFYYSQNRKVYDRMSISANELLVLLWLSNPSQLNTEDTFKFAKGGLSSYVTKYRRSKMPTIDTIRAIKKRADQAAEQGEIEEKDIYRMCIRMSEASLTKEDALEMTESSNEKFVNKIVELSKEDSVINGNLLKEIQEKKSIIDKQQNSIVKLEDQIEKLELERKQKEDYSKNIKIRLLDIEQEQYITKRNNTIDETLKKIKKKSSYRILGYLCFIVIISILWFINSYYANLLPQVLSSISAFILVVLFPIIPWFFNYKELANGLKFIFSKSVQKRIKEEEEKRYEELYPMQINSDIE